MTCMQRIYSQGHDNLFLARIADVSKHNSQGVQKSNLPPVDDEISRVRVALAQIERQRGADGHCVAGTLSVVELDTAGVVGLSQSA